jgi:hypothetical protein
MTNHASKNFLNGWQSSSKIEGGIETMQLAAKLIELSSLAAW